ncbi:MAG: PAS domain-containing protein [Janthinobacterium lividum]
MEAPQPTGPSTQDAAREAAHQQLTQQAAAVTDLGQARALLAEALTQQQALLLENQQLHAARQEQAATASRLQAAEAVAGMGSYELDLASGAFHFSEGLYQLLGEAPYSFTPSVAWLDARTDPEDVQLVQQVLHQARLDKQPYHYTRRIRRADGQPRLLESHGRVVCDAAGVAMRLESVVEDKTAQHQAAQALRESHELLQATLDSSLDMVQVFEAVRDERGEIVDFTWRLNNRISEQSYGDVVGQRLLAQNPGVVETGIFDTFRRVIETGQPDQSERHYTSEQFDGWFYQSTVKLRDGVATTTTDISELKKSQQEMLRLKEEAARQATERYQTLFGAIDQGFCIIENRYDAQGRALDYRFLEVSASFEQQTGIRNGAGRWVREIAANQDEVWFETYGRVGQTRQPEQFEHFSTPLGRWWSVYAFPIDEPAQHRIGVLFDDITVRKQHEQRQQLLVLLGDELRPLADAVAIQEAATRVALGFFGAERCYYGEIANGQCLIRRDAAAEGLPSVAGLYDLATMPLFQAVVDAARPFVVENAHTTELLDETLQQLCVQLQVISFLDVPVVKSGVTVGMLCLVQSTPRSWTPVEVNLALEAAERIWTAVERAKIEEALQKSEQQLHSFVTASSDTLYRMDADWQQMRSLQGRNFMSPTSAPSDNWFTRYIPPADQAAVRAAVQAAIKDQRFFELEHRVFRADGSVGWTFSRAVPVLGPQGELVEWFGTATDITARKQAEEALRASEEQLRMLVESLPGAAIFVVDANLRYLVAEGDALHRAGLRPADLLGRTVHEALPPELWLPHEAHYRAALAGQPFALEHEAHGRAFATRGVPLHHAPGHAPAVLAVSYDITERRQAEETLRKSEAKLKAFNQRLEQQVAERTRELRESQELLQSVFDTSLIAMSVMHAVRDEAGAIADFRIALVNHELENQSGRTDLVGRLYTQEYPGVVPAGVYDLILRAVATGQPQSLEYYYDQEGFHQWYSSQFVKLDDGVVATNLDITERKHAEQELLQNLRLLEQSEEVAQLGSWVHELATGELRWSAGMYRLFNLAPGTRVQPAIYFDYVVAADRPAAERVVQALTTAPAAIAEILRIQVGEVHKVLRIKIVVLYNEHGVPVQVLGIDFDVTEMQRLAADNLHLHLNQQQALFEAVQAAEEEERRRISESLHNGIGQLLYATKLQLDCLPDAPVRSPQQEAARLLGEAIQQTRTLSHELTPAILEEFGLEKTLRSICRSLNTPALHWHCHLVFEEELPLPISLQLAVYRLAQELAQNVLKHAHATEATLEVEVLPAWVVLRVEDNGRGFDLAGTSDGLGLRTLRSRVALLGGTVHVATAPSQGTQCLVRLPLSFLSS